MTEKSEPSRAIIDEENLDPAVDDLLTLGRRRGAALQQMLPEVQALRDEVSDMDVVEVLESAHKALADAPAKTSNELTMLRWAAFGELVERIVETSDNPSRSRERGDAISQLRVFVFNERVSRLAAHTEEPFPRSISRRLDEMLRRRLSGSS